MATILSSTETPNYYGDCTMQVPSSRLACNDFPSLTIPACDLPKVLKKAVWQPSALNSLNSIIDIAPQLMIGTPGNDKLTGVTGRQNILFGLAGKDTLIGADLNDHLFGGAGDDYLDGRAGHNTLTGGLGNDTYIINAAGSADTIVELAGQGMDKVVSSASYTLAANLENLTLSNIGLAFTHQSFGYDPSINTYGWLTVGADIWGNAINGTGNSLKNRIVGNSNNNVLTGAKGNDTLTGGYGQDTFVFRRGDGQDVIADMELSWLKTMSLTERWLDSSGSVISPPQNCSGPDMIDFKTGVNANQLWFKHIGNDLLIQTIGTSDSVLVKNWYSSTFTSQGGTIKASDNKSISAQNVENLVTAMAAFTPPSAGQTTLPSNYQTALAPVIAVNWQ